MESKRRGRKRGTPVRGRGKVKRVQLNQPVHGQERNRKTTPQDGDGQTDSELEQQASMICLNEEVGAKLNLRHEEGAMESKRRGRKRGTPVRGRGKVKRVQLNQPVHGQDRDRKTTPQDGDGQTDSELEQQASMGPAACAGTPNEDGMTDLPGPTEDGSSVASTGGTSASSVVDVTHGSDPEQKNEAQIRHLPRLEKLKTHYYVCRRCYEKVCAKKSNEERERTSFLHKSLNTMKDHQASSDNEFTIVLDPTPPDVAMYASALDLRRTGNRHLLGYTTEEGRFLGNPNVSNASRLHPLHLKEGAGRE